MKGVLVLSVGVLKKKLGVGCSGARNLDWKLSYQGPQVGVVKDVAVIVNDEAVTVNTQLQKKFGLNVVCFWIVLVPYREEPIS